MLPHSSSAADTPGTGTSATGDHRKSHSPFSDRDGASVCSHARGASRVSDPGAVEASAASASGVVDVGEEDE